VKPRARSRKLPALLVLVAIPSLAQDVEIQKQLIQRQQQSDAFLLQLRQSQERLQVPPGDLKRMQELDARHTGERQRLDNVSAKQLVEIKSDTPQELRPIERQRAADERAPLTIPSGGIDQTVESPR
jgi:multidrug resistance efflux pump